MNIHKNARIMVHGRGLLIERVEAGWLVADAAGALGRTVDKWLARYRAGGTAALDNCKPTPAHCPHRLPAERVAAIEGLRRERLSGPKIARRLAMPRTTVGAALRRLGLSQLASLDPKQPAVCYERQHPDELIHIDQRRVMVKNHSISWKLLHACVDDASKLAFTELLPDAQKQSARAFFTRVIVFFRAHGVRVERFMTNNGSAYSSHALHDLNDQSRLETHPHQALHPAHQRPRALHSDLPAQVGLPERLPDIQREGPSHAAIDHQLQL